MSNAKCLDCGRAIRNLDNAIAVSGGYVGPTCYKLRGPYSKPLKNMLRSNYDTVTLLKEMQDAQDNDSSLWKTDINQLLEERYGFSETPYYKKSGGYFGVLPHPDSYDYIDDGQVLLLDLDDDYYVRPDSGKTRTKSDLIELQRAKYCYAKMFKDPALEKTIFERYETQLGVRLYAVPNNMFVVKDKEMTNKNYSEFIIASDKSPYPERFMLIQVDSNITFKFFPMMLKDGKLVRGIGSINDSADAARSFVRMNDPDNFAYLAGWFMRKNPLEAEAFRTRMHLWKELHFKNKKSDRVFFEWNWDKDEKIADGSTAKFIKQNQSMNRFYGDKPRDEE